MTNNPLKWVRPVITRPASFFSSEGAISFITLPLAMKRPVGYKQSEWAATCQTDEPELHQSVLQSVCGQNISDSFDSTRLITHSELWIIWIVSRYQRGKKQRVVLRESRLFILDFCRQHRPHFPVVFWSTDGKQQKNRATWTHTDQQIRNVVYFQPTSLLASGGIWSLRPATKNCAEEERESLQLG